MSKTKAWQLPHDTDRHFVCGWFLRWRRDAFCLYVFTLLLLRPLFLFLTLFFLTLPPRRLQTNHHVRTHGRRKSHYYDATAKKARHRKACKLNMYPTTIILIAILRNVGVGMLRFESSKGVALTGGFALAEEPTFNNVLRVPVNKKCAKK